ncbi:MAG: hypothetical protein N4A38_01810 [Candidatus Gracilibacteria bacterium]|jgi:hypothetical protein|nr:hypothetical protein [Candidatus Gracilibacteria bacterium]
MIRYLISFVIIFVIIDMPLNIFWQTNNFMYPSFPYEAVRLIISALLALFACYVIEKIS